jgi:dihydroneopterin aldolase
MLKYEASLVLRGLVVSASIGVHDFERENRQRLLIDVELTLVNPRRPRQDDISAVLDYRFLHTEIQKLVDAGHYELQETLTHDIAEFCLSRPEVTRVSIHTRKPDIYPDVESIGYNLTVEK